MEVDLSIIICTYNRAELLSKCLQSIVDNGRSFTDRIEIVVVDNKSVDETHKVVHQMISSNRDYYMRYVKEENQGLSYARNKGAEASNGEFLFFLDDDAYIQEATIGEIFKSLKLEKFEFFGGIYEAYYEGEKPKWLSKDFGTKKTTLIGLGELPKEEIIEGGVMIIKKSLLKHLGMFNVNLGMRGNDLGFSEESELQLRAKNQSILLGLNPQIKVFHLVSKKKYEVAFHLKVYYFLARDRQRSNRPIKVNAIRTLGLLPFRIVKYFLKMVKEKDYYYQNFVWDSFSSLFLVLGNFMGRI